MKNRSSRKKIKTPKSINSGNMSRKYKKNITVKRDMSQHEIEILDIKKQKKNQYHLENEEASSDEDRLIHFKDKFQHKRENRKNIKSSSSKK